MTLLHKKFTSQGNKLAAVIDTPDKTYRTGLIRISGGANLPCWPNSWQEHLANREVASATFDFTGVGESEGELSQTSLNARYADSFEAFKLFCEETGLKAEQVYLLGVSMGAPLAIKLAYEKQTKGLVLASPAAYSKDAWGKNFGEDFSKVIRTQESWKNSSEFERLKEFRGRVMLGYGLKDEIIPEAILKKYKSIIKEKEGMVLELDAMHTFLREKSDETEAGSIFWSKLADFVKG